MSKLYQFIFRFKKTFISILYPERGIKYSKEYKGNKYTVFNGMSNYIWILDAGHGGVINGKYQTQGRSSPIWDDETQLLEGVSNRDLVNRIIKKLEKMNISYINLVDTQKDISNELRVELANLLYDGNKNEFINKEMIYISIHSDKWISEDVRGWTIFTSIGQNLDDKIAEHFAHKFKQIFPNEKLRSDISDGDLDMEVDFMVLKYTKMPSILTKNFFMTNPHECRDILMDDISRDLIAKLHYESIFEIDKLKLIG